MKKATFFLVMSTLLLTLSCQQKADIEAEEMAIEAILEDYVASIEEEDMDLYAAVVAHDPDMVNYGGFGEPIMGWDALEEVIENQNASLSQTEIDVSDLAIHVSETGKLAWATCLWNLRAMMGENSVELPIRCTWILEKRENGWVIVHFHKSTTAG